MLLLGCGGALLEGWGLAQDRESLAGESAAQTLKDSVQAQARQYNWHYGPVYLQAGAGVRFGYTDNVLYSDKDRKDDFLINPEVNLGAFVQVSELNALKVSLGVGYEYYVNNTVLNSDLPLINPDSELSFNLFVGDFHFRFHEKFTYQESLFFNSVPYQQNLFYNITTSGRFTRWDNMAGFDVDWDLNKVILSATYNHENFVSTTASYDYLTRASEWFTASASFLLGDHFKAGVEGQAGLHYYDSEVVLNDHWQARGGPFAEVSLPEKITFRAGGGYDTARYGSAARSSDFETYYAYGRVSQETRLFTHSITGGREHALGQNANNWQTTYVRYAIASPVIEHVELSANASVNFAREYGGAFTEDFTYYIVGLRAGWQFHKYWRTDVGYEYMLKNSDLPLRDFYRNRVTLGLTFAF
ncbi:MAG TPA: hypothetical protein VJA21_26895 [Verrucomicrobiae bacterium]